MVEIEKEILEKLMYNSSLNYNSLWKKKKYPSSKFNYHLKKLVKDELLIKNENGEYELTQKGTQYIAELNNKKLEKQTIPLTCSFVLCINENNEVLLQKRKKQPYLGIVNIPGGKVQFGESTYQAGMRELFEESKLIIESMQLKMIDEVRTYDYNKNIFAHIIAYTYVCREFSGKLEEENQEGEMRWYSLEEIQNIENIFPNLKKTIPKLMISDQLIVQKTRRFMNEDGNFIKYDIEEDI